MTRETIDLDALDLPAVETRTLADPAAAYQPFAGDDDQPVPTFLPIGGGRIVRQTSSTHGPDGYITTDPDLIAASQKRLSAKIIADLDDFTYYELLGAPGARTLVIAYGVTARAARAAVADLNRSGSPTALLVLNTLWPVPVELLRARAEAFDRIVVIEMNLGQYVREIERILAPRKITFYGQMNGELIKPARIREAVTHG